MPQPIARSSRMSVLPFCWFVVSASFVDTTYGCIGYGMNLAGLAMPCAYNYDGASVASRPCYSPYCAYAYCAARQKASGAKTAELDGFVGPFAINGSSGNMSSEAAVNGVDDPVAAAAAGTVGIWEPTARLGTRQGVSKSNENGTGKLTPDDLFYECCQTWALPGSCLEKCNYVNYTADALRAMFFRTDKCPIESASIIHYCASQNQDHTSCCVESGYASTPAGEKCLIFCEKMPQNETSLDYSYLPCFEKFSEMKLCFFENSLRSIDILELELALAQDRRRKLENPNRISGGGSQMDNKNLDEGDAHRPPVIFVSDTEPKFPRIHDALNNDKRANNKSRTEKRPNTDAYN